jgi:hypothetical protein
MDKSGLMLRAWLTTDPAPQHGAIRRVLRNPDNDENRISE